jgi:hypothetical protein
VGEPVAEVVRVTAGEDLRLVLQPPEGTRVDDAVAITLEVVAVRMARLRITPPTALFGAQRVGS